ncbi:MAG: BACON domain-containing protein, partial [Bacteroidales bacterium]|nr:BACON domain-containing protein [Bacteroidales bacterium]
MKLRNIITSLFAAAAVLVGCQKQETLQLSEVQVDCSYVALNVGGSSATVNVTANDSWTISGAPAWLTVSPTSGAAGTTQVTFSAASTLDGRNCELALECGGKTQYINVIQGLAVINQATCKEVIAGPDGKSYKVSGVCTKISNTTYGNFYINDGTGEVY